MGASTPPPAALSTKRLPRSSQALIPLPVIAYSAALSVERRVSHEDMVSLGGNLHSVPDVIRKRAVEAQSKAEREGRLVGKIRSYAGTALLVVDEIGYLPITTGGASLFLQLVNARHEKGAMILTSNRGLAEWAEVFGDPVVATALLDRLLHHAVVA